MLRHGARLVYQRKAFVVPQARLLIPCSAPVVGKRAEASSSHDSQPSSDDEVVANAEEDDHAPVHSTPCAARTTEPPVSAGDTSFLERLMTPQVPRKRGRPRKDAKAVRTSFSTSIPMDPPIKRKRGRPRKRPWEPHEELARLVAKQSATIPPWQIMAPVDRPPIYPETHVFFQKPQRVRTPMLWESPERPKPAAPRWWHYRRPTLQHVPAKRADGITSEPLPLAPPGRRPRTRIDTLALQHAQLANRARGAQLDLHSLWQRRVAQAIAAGHISPPAALSTDTTCL